MTSSSAVRILGVLGLSGGVGASTLAASLALRAAAGGRRTLLVDGHPDGGGLALLLGDGLGAGLAWPDLQHAGADLDVEAIWTRLPRLGSCAVLSWTLGPGADPSGPRAQTWVEVAGPAALCVVDLPYSRDPCWQEWVERCSGVLLVAGACIQGIVSAMSTCERLTRRDVDVVGLVVRSPQLVGSGTVERSLGVPVLGVLDQDPSVQRALTRGRPVGADRGPLAHLVDRLLVGQVLGEVEVA